MSFFNQTLFRKILFSLILIVFYSCDSNRMYDKNKSIAGSNWQIKDFKKFDVEINDTLNLYKFYINVRNTGDYKYSNLFLFITTSLPDHFIVRDTAQLILADHDGRWLGTGTSNFKDNRLLLKKGIRFHQKGIYSFTIEHGMRDKILEGISDIGIRIEKQ